MNRLRTMTAVGLSAAVFAGGCGETPVDPKQQKMNEIAQRTANKVVGQMVVFAESDRGAAGDNDPVVDTHDTDLGGTLKVSKLKLDDAAVRLDCEGETNYYVAEVNYDAEDPSQVSRLNVYSDVSYQYGNCKEEDSYTTSRDFRRDEDGNWSVTVSRFDTLDSDRSLSDSTYKQAETVGAVRKIAADAQKDIELLLADEPR